MAWPFESTVSSFFVSYAVTGSGTFGRGVDVVTGSAADQVNVVGQLAGSPIGVYTGDGNDGISVYANPTSEYFLFLDGQAGANMLFVIDISGTGIIQNFPTSATSGEAEVNYPAGCRASCITTTCFWSRAAALPLAA